MNTELQSEFVKIEVQTSDFSFLYLSRHQLMSLDCLNCVTIDQLTFSTALSMSLKDVDIFDVVFRAKNGPLLNTSD